MPPRKTRTSAKARAGESEIPTSTSLGAGTLGVSGFLVASKLSLPSTRKKKDQRRIVRTTRTSAKARAGESESLPSTRKKKDIIVHDLGPVHTVLVSLATSLQVKVDRANLDLLEIRTRLADEM